MKRIIATLLVIVAISTNLTANTKYRSKCTMVTNNPDTIKICLEREKAFILVGILNALERSNEINQEFLDIKYSEMNGNGDEDNREGK